jgi:dipeptidase E
MHLLLISNSTQHGGGYLDHCAEEVADFLGGIRDLIFVPYALADWNGYTSKTKDRYAAMGVRVTGIQEYEDKAAAFAACPALHIGGGNTFRLLKKLYEENLVETIRARVRQGMRYIGASAGTNVATVSIRTTNDMPIVYPPTFDALGLVPFNINPHYVDADPNSTHKGETREQRILEFHEENDNPVVGLREGTMLRLEGHSVQLKGLYTARIFRKGQTPTEFPPGSRLDFLLK